MTNSWEPIWDELIKVRMVDEKGVKALYAWTRAWLFTNIGTDDGLLVIEQVTACDGSHLARAAMTLVAPKDNVLVIAPDLYGVKHKTDTRSWALREAQKAANEHIACVASDADELIRMWKEAGR